MLFFLFLYLSDSTAPHLTNPSHHNPITCLDILRVIKKPIDSTSCIVIEQSKNPVQGPYTGRKERNSKSRSGWSVIVIKVWSLTVGLDPPRSVAWAMNLRRLSIPWRGGGTYQGQEKETITARKVLLHRWSTAADSAVPVPVGHCGLDKIME